MSEDAPTYDELLAKFNALSNEVSTIKEEKEALKSELDNTKKNLEDSRALNTKLMFSDRSVHGSISPTPKPEPEHEETLEEFIDSFAKTATEIVNKKYGEKIYGDNY